MATILKRQPAPWHLWLVGALALIWNGFGAFDFSMTVLKGAAYLRSAGMGEAMVAYFQTLPAWLYGPWAVGVWGGVVGSLFLLARRKWAVVAYALSLLGALSSQMLSLWVYPPPAGAAPQGAMAYMHYVIIAIAIFLWFYAWRMSRKTVLV